MNESLSDHKMMVQDIFIETAAISKTLESLSAQLKTLTSNVEHLDRTIQTFTTNLPSTQEQIIKDVSTTSASVFNDQLEKLEAFQNFVDMLSSGEITITKKKKGWFK